MLIHLLHLVDLIFDFILHHESGEGYLLCLLPSLTQSVVVSI